MLIVWIIIVILVASFGGVIIFGAPYVPTMKAQTEQALDLSGLRRGQSLIELGSGDGRVALAAARRGYQVVGYELNPILVLVSLVVTWRYRDLVSIRWANFLKADWPEARAVFIFGLDKLMPKIDRKLSREAQKPVRLVSYAFKVPGRQQSETSGALLAYDYR